jgi:predicted O-methyltransferase YrrM
MSEPLWTAVDDYIAELFLPPDEALTAALAASEAAGLPAIHVAPAQGKFLSLLARAMGGAHHSGNWHPGRLQRYLVRPGFAG